MSCNYVLKGGVNKGTQCPKKISKSDPSGTLCCSHVVKPKKETQTSTERPKSKNNIDGLNFKDLSNGYLESDSEGDEEVGEEEQQYRQQYNFNQNQNQNQNQPESDLDVLDLHASESDDESVDIQGLLSQLKKLSTSCPHAPTKNGIKDCIVYLQSF